MGTLRVRPASEGSDDGAAMAAEIRDSLRASVPWLPCKYFYDDRGSRLFDAITQLPEYYQTRTEEAILQTSAGDIIRRTRPADVVELGSGMGRKIRMLLDAAVGEGLSGRCSLLDVNEAGLHEAGGRLAAEYPGFDFEGIVGDFTQDLGALSAPVGRRLMVFFAGTIGNLHPDEVPSFLCRVAGRLLRGDAFLVGVDLVKDVSRLEAAYNDSAGVTAEFNLNILRVLNQRLEADFDLGAFEHVAFYDRERAWIEMRLRALRPTQARIPRAGLSLRLARGDEIRTEISCKYTRESLQAKLSGSGLVLSEWYSDPERLFALALLQRV
jgi:L-histidine N-alpha-methyltransferase